MNHSRTLLENPSNDTLWKYMILPVSSIILLYQTIKIDTTAMIDYNCEMIP